MVRETPKSVSQKRPRFEGVRASARALGVSHTHLWFVLAGVRKSPRLLARYRQLKAAPAPAV